MAKPAENQDRQQAAAFLRLITSQWYTLREKAHIELRALFPGKAPQIARFAPDDTGIDLAVDFACMFSAQGYNIYPVINPVRASAPLRRDGKQTGATDDDIICSFFCWADGDDEAAVYAIKNFAGPKYSFAVTTGKTPFPRPHIYWALEEPIYNLTTWTQIQRGIAAQLSTDKTVVNPSRIMRLPGMVNWPTEKKAAKGYIPELATLRTEYEDERAPVSAERMWRIFGEAGERAAQPAGTGFQIDTGDEFQRLDVDETLQGILSGDHWNHRVNQLVWRMAALGLTDSEIGMLAPGLTLPGYTVEESRAEMMTMLRYARAAGNKPKSDQDEQFRELTDEEKDAIPGLDFKPWGHKDLTAIPYPEFLYSDFYARGYTSLTLAAPKVGKSMLGLAEALDMASGRGFLTGHKRDKLRVLYYNAEDDQAVIDSRVSALLTAYGIDQSEIADTFFPVSGVDRDDFFLISGQEGVINEALFVSLEKFIQANRIDGTIFDPLQDLSRSPETNEVFRALGQRMRRLASTMRIAQGIIHHTRKVTPGMTPTIDDGRGGSALRGTARFNRLLISMTEDDAAKAGVQNHRNFMRIGDMESNLAPPSADVNRWFEKVSVLTPNGREVGAIRPWQWPDAFDGVTPQDAARVRAEIDRMNPPPRLDVRSSAWAGNVVADVLGLNLDKTADKARVKSMLAKWIETDVLRQAEEHDARAGRSVRVVICGANNPIAEAR